MREKVIILNCARGELVDSDAMHSALESGRVGGYGSDVLDTEPPARNHPLLGAPNCIITSHIASRTHESVSRQAGMATRNLIALLTGEGEYCPGQQLYLLDHMPEQFHIVPEAEHEALVAAAYRNRGFTHEEANDAARFCSFASAHAVRTHNAIKALHLDELFGSGTGGCVPGASIEVVESRFAASEVWNCNRKLGQKCRLRRHRALY